MGQGKTLRVLIVEDSEDDALLVVRELTRAGYAPIYERVETAAAMARALDDREWDAIVSDYSMPRFSGPAALALMKAKGVDLPFLIVSRAIGEETAVEAMKAGAHDYLMKRNLTRLGPAIEREVREARVRREKRLGAAALLESEERYKELTDFLPEAVFEADANGRVVFLNRRGRELFGYTQNELEGGLDALAFFSPTDRPRVEANARRVLRGEDIGVNPYTATRKDGGSFPALVHSNAIVRAGEAVGLRGVIIDVTTLQQTQQERSRLATAVEQAAEAVIIADSGGAIQYVNPAFEGITGYSRGDAVGRNITFLNAETEEGDVLSRIEETLRRGAAWAGPLRGRRRDGSPYDEECTLSPVRDEVGALINYVVVCRDVTEQLRLERQFRHAQKLEALGTLAGGIAHDFNNILMPIIGYTQLTADELPDGSEARENLERVLAAADRARDLIGQILAFSREVEQPRRPIHLVPIVKETLKLMKASLPATVEIRHRLDAAEDTVLADPVGIHQVLVNLCTNAGLAMEGAPGVLDVVLRQVEADPDFVARNPDMKEGSYLQLTVTDTGCGMTRDVVERAFEPFFTTRRAQGGTGLGLAAVHGIVKSLGGTIRLYSEPGRGTTFHIYLPRAERAEEPQPDRDRPIPTGTERILLVDDEESIVELGRRMLEGLGYRVVTAASGLEALRAFRASPAEFDVVITDQTMPKMTGRSLIRRIRHLRPDIPVILTSGFSRTLSAEEAASLGEVCLVFKPVTKRELGEAVRRALTRPAPPRP